MRGHIPQLFRFYLEVRKQMVYLNGTPIAPRNIEHGVGSLGSPLIFRFSQRLMTACFASGSPVCRRQYAEPQLNENEKKWVMLSEANVLRSINFFLMKKRPPDLFLYLSEIKCLGVLDQ